MQIERVGWAKDQMFDSGNDETGWIGRDKIQSQTGDRLS